MMGQCDRLGVLTVGDPACQSPGGDRVGPRPWRRLATACGPAGLGRDALCIGVLGAILLASVLLVGPGGEFPLNDDWSFVRSTRTLVVAHDWRPTGWAGMTQISNALLGYAVCSVSACSFEHLRAATLCAGLALLLACFGLFRSTGASRFVGVLGAVAVVFNPILHPLLYTFMTDVGFALLIVAAAFACIALLRTDRWRYVAASAVLLALATLSRQLGIAMALGLIPIHLLSSRAPLGIRVVKAGLPFATCLAALLLYEHWMRQTGRLPFLYDSKYEDLIAALGAPGQMLVHGVINLLLAGLYFGFVCLPVLLQQLPGPRAGGVEPVLAGPAFRWATLVTGAMLVVMIRNGSLMPLLGNVFGKAGIGPLTLRDTYVLRLHDVPDLPLAFWIAVTGCSLLGLWLLVFRTLSLLVEARPSIVACRLAPELAVRLFGLVTAGLYLLPLLPGEVYDRYVAVVAPILCLCLLPSEPRERRTVRVTSTVFGCAAAAGLALVSVLATHDYLAWNRARWDAIGSVEAAHEADPATMDGGFEYNGYHAYDPLYVRMPQKSWWWIADDRIQIGFGRIPGTDVLRRYPYRTWFPPDTRFISVLRRASDETPP